MLYRQFPLGGAPISQKTAKNAMVSLKRSIETEKVLAVKAMVSQQTSFEYIKPKS